MKRIYSILASAAIFASAAQAQNERLPLEPFNPDKPLIKDAPGSTKARVMSSAPTNATWEAIGTGYWKEGFLDQLVGPIAGSSWEVTIEEAKEYPGYYRMLPYASEDNPVSSAIDTTDSTNYVYINATNPSKVYVEDFFAFDFIMISNRVPENKWSDSKYGTLADGIITFPNSAFSYTTYDLGEHQPCDFANYFQVALPGHEIKDYSMEIDLPACAENNTMPISITRGSDVATVKVLTAYGYYLNSDSNNKFIATNGAVVDPNKGYLEFEANDDAPFGMYTTMAVGLNDKGAIVAARCAYSHILDNNEADWKVIGSATMPEAILVTVYSEASQQLLTCPVEESISTPGRFRLVNPYAEHLWAKAYSDFLINHDHPHYIYINATDPNMVYVEPAPLGINSDGEASLYSLAAYYVETGSPAIAQQYGYFGRMIVDDGEYIISMPDGSLMFAESHYNNGAYYSSIGQNFIVVITPENSAVEEVEINDDAFGPTEYYNLQGIRMAHPRQGQLVIERRGSKVSKTIVK